MTRRAATWRKGGALRVGSYEWVWHAQRFLIELDRPVAFGDGTARRFALAGDTPEWGGWKLQCEQVSA